MAKWTRVLCCLAIAGFSAGAAAQKWTVYSPQEKDFRVVFPQPPARAAVANGAVAFTATAERIEYAVYRRDPRLEPVENATRAMRQRLKRADDDERPVRRKKGEDDDPATTERVFQSGDRVSIHRLFVAKDRYYELVVRSSRQEASEARVTSRDFFGSFQMGGAVLAPAGAAGVAPDVLCKGRGNAFSRTYCEYRTCLQPGYDKHPYCVKLLPW